MEVVAKEILAMIEFFDGTVIPILASTLRSSTPLVIAALAGLFCERAGIINIALEGKMLGAAFARMPSAQMVHTVAAQEADNWREPGQVEVSIAECRE